MEEYKKAKDVRLGDIFYSAYKKEITERTVYKLEKYGGFISIEGNIHFKENGSKGFIANINKYDIQDRFNSTDFDELSTLYTTDIRCAKTFVKNYCLREIAKENKAIQKSTETIQELSKRIAELV